MITINEKKYKTITQACKELDISYNTAYVKAKRANISIEKAIELILHAKENGVSSRYKPILIEGESYNNLEEACIALDLDVKKVRSYMYKHKLSETEAIQEYLDPEVYRDKKATKVIVNGETFRSKQQACEHYDLPYNRVRGRFYNSDKDFEDVINEMIEGRDKRCKETVYEGVIYDSILDFCDKNGLDYKRFIAYKQFHEKKGLTFNNIVELFKLREDYLKSVKEQEMTVK